MFKDPKPEILEFVEKHKGELVLDLHEVVKLVGFEDIENDDYYYVCLSLIKGKYLESCVGNLYPLKGVLPDNEYDELIRVFDLNIEQTLQSQKKLNKVVVKYDPLYENVICVHTTEEGMCENCKSIVDENRTRYQLYRDWFEVVND